MALPLSDNSPSYYPVTLSPRNPLHIVYPEVIITERQVVDGQSTDFNPEYPFSYYLTRQWDCNCVALGHKKKSLDIIRFKSPLEHPDPRFYRCLFLIASMNPSVEPPHARVYREHFGSDGVFLYLQWMNEVEDALRGAEQGTED
jgi:hypothetical protein